MGGGALLLGELPSSSSSSSAAANNKEKEEDCADNKKKNSKKPRAMIQASFWAKSRARIACFHPSSTAICGTVRIRAATSQSQVIFEKDQNDFISWLKRRKEHEVYASVTMGVCESGRGLFAAKPIQQSERILQISRNLILTSDNLHNDVKRSLKKAIDKCAILALVILAEQHAGEESEWAPYIDIFPPICALHNSFLWSDDDLEMIRDSTNVYRETIQLRDHVLKEFSNVQEVLLKFPHIFGDNVSFASFQHAYAIVNSRAWGLDEHGTVGLVPFVDFLNHDPNCRSFLSFDEKYEYAEVIADRNYATGEQVVVKYGKFGNDVLLVTFGFTLPHNPYDQVEIWMGFSQRDAIWREKVQLLNQHGMAMINGEGDECGGNFFFIREVKCVEGHGKGIPQSLRAFVRVLCAESTSELSDMATEASQNDGRLARRPLKNKHRELQAMIFLLARIETLTQARRTALMALQLNEYCRVGSADMSVRRLMALTILHGELRILESTANWLKHYCQTLSTVIYSKECNPLLSIP